MHTFPQLGRGGFGVVYQGSLYGSPVAIKMLHTNVSDSEEFIHEITVMRRLRHPNIVLFLGATVSPDPLCIVTELVSRGALMKEIEHPEKPLDLAGMGYGQGAPLRKNPVFSYLLPYPIATQRPSAGRWTLRAA
jgi:serine/threonine protein kinase